MRVLFLALLLVNVAFFAWEYRHPEPTPAPVTEVEPGIPPLHLVRGHHASAVAPARKPAPGAPKSAPGAPKSAPDAAAAPEAGAGQPQGGTVQR